jgi:class 3 adenylate cyclase
LLGNAAHFPLANLFFEIVIEGWQILAAPDAYVLICSALTQAWVASGWQRAGRSRPMRSNLIGPAVYLGLETLIEGLRFFVQPNHLIYLGFGIGVGITQWLLQRSTSERIRLFLLLAEGLSRGVILLMMYVFLEAHQAPVGLTKPFFSDPSHRYITMALISLGLLLGFYAYFEQRTLIILRETARKLRKFSEWSFGRELTSRAVINADALSLQAVDLCIVFVDLRGFTAWSESRPPRDVVNMLNEFYGVVDSALAKTAGIIKIKFTADEAMLVIKEASTGLTIANDLRAQLAPFLARHALGAGFGIHFGPTVQGLLGSESVRLFDVIGDTVNVAKRLCDQALAGEILVTETTVLAAASVPNIGHELERRTLAVKGKATPLAVVVM